jgi:hypothetical protein
VTRVADYLFDVAIRLSYASIITFSNLYIVSTIHRIIITKYHTTYGAHIFDKLINTRAIQKNSDTHTHTHTQTHKHTKASQKSKGILKQCKCFFPALHKNFPNRIGFIFISYLPHTKLI